VIQVGRVVASSLSSKTSVPLYSVEGIGGVDRTFPTDPVSDKADGAGETIEKAELFGALGIVGRPLTPTQSRGRPGHMEVISVRGADGMIPIAARDTRLHSAFPNPQPGDITVVGYGANFMKLAADGTIAWATTSDGTPNGAMAQMQLKGDGFQLVGPWGKIIYDSTGFHLLHFTGTRIDLGGIGGLPAPFSELGSYCNISAAIMRINASAITLGNGLLPEPVAKSKALQTVLTAISAALAGTPPGTGGISKALAELALIPSNAPAATACGEAVAAIALAAASITIGAVTIRSTTSVT
jgi:hypothetical protein